MENNYVDLQLNGCFGLDFNSLELNIDSLNLACVRLAEQGAQGVLATVITDDVDSMADRIRRIVAAIDRHTEIKRMILGIHIEGPFLSPSSGFHGAHPERFILKADLDLAKRLVDAGQGMVRIVTLAPEQDPNCEVIRWLMDHKIVVAAGHTDASIDQLSRAIASGLKMFTHLGNGCPRVMDRHDNIIQRVLSLAADLWVSLIADGFHLPWFVIKNFLGIIGFDRAILVSDATAAAGMEQGAYRLGEQPLEIGRDGQCRLAGDSGYLAGSTTLLSSAAVLAQANLGLSQREVEKLISENPRRVLAGERP